jgi:hypothetical protein
MNITEVASAANIVYNRYLGATLVLPFTGFDTIKIQPNDVAIAPVVNQAFSKLYTNFLYLYKSARVASNIIPISSVGVAGVSANSTNFRWFTYAEGLSTSQFIPLSTAVVSTSATANLYNQDRIIDIAAVQNRETNNFSIFTTTGTDIVVYNADNRFFNNTIDKDLSISPVFSANQTYKNSGIYWKGINDFAFGEENSLYVLDLSSNRVVKYDASGFLTSDTVLKNTLIYEDSMGGLGSYDDRNLFSAPRSIDVCNSDLFVLDSGNGCVKRYDKDLNWRTTYRLFRDFLSAYPVHLSHDSAGNMYVLTTNETILKYDNNFQNKTTIYLDNLSAFDSIYKKVIFSKYDPNIFYTLASEDLFKRLVDQPDEDVGKYLFYLHRVNTKEIYTGFDTISTFNGDINITFSQSNGVGKFSAWFDNLNLFDVLNTKEFDVYSLEDIKISHSEYLQNWVFNKALSKLILNHMRLRDQIFGKFLSRIDSYSNITFRGTRYLTPEEYATINYFEQNITNYIGMNEILQNNIINRCLEHIYNVQVAMLNILQAETQINYDQGLPVFIN